MHVFIECMQETSILSSPAGLTRTASLRRSLLPVHATALFPSASLEAGSVRGTGKPVLPVNKSNCLPNFMRSESLLVIVLCVCVCVCVSGESLQKIPKVLLIKITSSTDTRKSAFCQSTLHALYIRMIDQLLLLLPE